MSDDWGTAAILVGIITPVVVVIEVLRRQKVERRRRAWRRAAEDAGLVPSLGPWVVGEVAGTWIEAGDHEHRSRQEISHWSAIRALIVAPLPDGLVVSTDTAHPGIVRRRLPCGRREVIVRGIDEAEVEAFLGEGRADALVAFFAAVPDAVIEGNLVDAFAGNRLFLGIVTPPVDWEKVTGAIRVWHRTRIGESMIAREVPAFVELTKALHKRPAASYR